MSLGINQPNPWYHLPYWVDWCWKNAEGNHEQYARLMRIFVRNQQLTK